MPTLKREVKKRRKFYFTSKVMVAKIKNIAVINKIHLLLHARN
jgi:hypothetical protein